MNAEKAARIIKRLAISTAILAILSTSLLMFVIMRPIEIREIKAEGPGQVVYDLGNGRKIIAPGNGIVEWEGNFADKVAPATTNRTDDAKAAGVTVSSFGTATSLAM